MDKLPKKERLDKLMKDLNYIGAEAETMQHMVLKADDRQISKIIDKTKLRQELNNSCSLLVSKIDSIRILIDLYN